MSTYMSPKMRIRGMKPATGTLLERGISDDDPDDLMAAGEPRKPTPGHEYLDR
jgi:hypothetical protein